ncbi:methyltransferase [Polynucleobacter kasalickyi]|uniref:Hydroxyneurosporene-O-methyltransferase n=1 Tax=Polynucleobacter kasalickyi TaxID=1938817 RepID=A0A1W1Z0F7_9BURK|nr:methyltransferase [Polynucleobacter kasalickyi]SMC41920.1 hydroxyneurosporene-O-methyltransferase [Polynucleobacter kasalickyi]
MSKTLPFQASEPGVTYSIFDQIVIWKDRQIAKRSFQRLAAGIPIFRSISKTRANDVFDLMAGFVYSQILLACVQVELFQKLADGPKSQEELLSLIPLPPKGLERLLLAAESLELLERRSNQRYGLGRLGAPMVNNDALCSMILHHTALYEDLRDPLSLLRGDPRKKILEQYWPYITEQEEELRSLSDSEKVSEYSKLMSDSLPLVADEVIEAYDFSKHHTHLDIGGGQGTFLRLVAPHAPNLEMQLFDLPGVANLAQEQFKQSPIANRVDCIGGNFFEDTLPKGADIITLIRVIFDHDDNRVLHLLKKIRETLPKGGVLLIAEPMADTPEIPAMGQAYFGMYLLAMGRGKPRSTEDLKQLLTLAGFSQFKVVKTKMAINAQVLLAGY